MCDDGVDALLAALRGALLIIQQFGLEIEDRAPILHRAEELRRARPRDHVELGQRVWLTEIVVVIGQQALGLGERIIALIDHAAPRDDADLGLARHHRLALDIAHAEEQQIARHFRRLGKAIQLGAVALLGHADGRHVREGHLLARRDRAHPEGRLIRRLIPHRREATRVGGLELRRQHPRRRAILIGVIDREETCGRGVDRAGPGEVERVLPSGYQHRRG